MKKTEIIEISEKNKKLRIAGSVILLVIGLLFLGICVYSLFDVGNTRKEITLPTGAKNTGGDFVLTYDFTEYGSKANSEYKKISALYSEISNTAYELFSSDEEFEGKENIYTVNRKPNRNLTVHETLYRALRHICKDGCRYLYLAPISSYCEYLFLCESDGKAAMYDPRKNPDVRNYFDKILKYARDGDMIDMEFPAENTVRLKVSDEYMRFAKENGISDFIGFSWLKNAYIADFFADMMEKNGFKRCVISSYDGYMRNLDDSGKKYSYNIFSREDGVSLVAVADYIPPASVACLKSFPAVGSEKKVYYKYADSSTRHRYVDPSDGLSKNAVPVLIAYGEKTPCADLALAAAKIFISNDFDISKVRGSVEKGINFIWCSEHVIYHTDARAEFSASDERYTVNTVK